MSVASSQKPNIKPVVLAEISVAMKMVGAVLSVAESTAKNDLVTEGGLNSLVTEGEAFKLTTEGT